MPNETQDSSQVQSDLPQNEIESELQYPDDVDVEMAKEYGFTPQQAEEMSL